MGKIADLLAEVATAIEEGPGNLVLPAEDRERLRRDWSEDDIDDAVALVRDNLLQVELMDSADSLNSRLVDLLGAFGEEDAFRKAQAGQAVVNLDVLGQVARRVIRLEEILEVFRDGAPPDRPGLDALAKRLVDAGIEPDMRDEWAGMNDEREEEDPF